MHLKANSSFILNTVTDLCNSFNRMINKRIDRKNFLRVSIRIDYHDAFRPNFKDSSGGLIIYIVFDILNR
jgi:hypothetical protein